MLIEQQNGLVYETIHRRKNAASFPVEASARVITIQDKKFIQMTVRDITERKRTEESVRKLNRIYAVLSEINQAIVRNDNIDELFREICRVAVDYGQFRIAWIGKVDIMTRRVIPVTSAGIVGTALENLFISTEEIPEGMGPTGVAVREKRCVVCNDVLSDERMKPWREEAISNNYRSLAVIPLVTDGRVAYVLNVKVSTPNFFDKDEIRLLEEIGSDISFALETMGKEARRKQSEKDLHISEERYRGLF